MQEYKTRTEPLLIHDLANSVGVFTGCRLIAGSTPINKSVPLKKT